MVHVIMYLNIVISTADYAYIIDLNYFICRPNI